MITADQNLLYKHVEFLTSIEPPRNYENLESLEKVVGYITDCFASYNLSLSKQKWLAEGREYTNVIASWAPEKETRLIIGAHYDVCGNQPGADDNASAVAGLLETARMFTQNDPDTTYGVDFVAYCLEEPPFFATEHMGSYVHAKSLSETGVNVKGMICYEMIGYFSEEPNSQTYPTPELAKIYPDKANFIIVVGIAEHETFNQKFYHQMAKKAKIDIQKITFPAPDGLAGMSDHRSYWQFQFPALMINDTSFLRNPNYHEVTDTIETLDFPKMTEVVNATYQACVSL